MWVGQNASVIVDGSMLSPNSVILDTFSLYTPLFSDHLILFTDLAALNRPFLVTANIQISL